MKLPVQMGRNAATCALAIFLVTTSVFGRECDPAPTVRSCDPSNDEIQQVKAEIEELRKRVKARADPHPDPDAKITVPPTASLEQLSKKMNWSRDNSVHCCVSTRYYAHGCAEIDTWTSGPICAFKFDDTVVVGPFMSTHAVGYPVGCVRGTWKSDSTRIALPPADGHGSRRGAADSRSTTFSRRRC